MYFTIYNNYASAKFDDLTWFENYIAKVVFPYENRNNPERIVYYKIDKQWWVGVRGLKYPATPNSTELDEHSIACAWKISTDSPTLLGTKTFKLFLYHPELDNDINIL